MKRSSRRASLGASAAWATGQSAPGDRARSSRAFFSARVWAISPTAWHGCGRLVSRAPLQLNSRSVGRRQHRDRSGDRPTWSYAGDQWQYHGLGIGTRIQHPLLDRSFAGGSPQEEPLNQLVLLIEFAFDTPIGHGLGRKTPARPILDCRTWRRLGSWRPRLPLKFFVREEHDP